MSEAISDEKAQLWITGFDPHEHGWRVIGPADDEGSIELALALRQDGVGVETFISPVGKLSYYVPASELDRVIFGGGA